MHVYITPAEICFRALSATLRTVAQVETEQGSLGHSYGVPQCVAGVDVGRVAGIKTVPIKQRRGGGGAEAEARSSTAEWSILDSDQTTQHSFAGGW